MRKYYLLLLIPILLYVAMPANIVSAQGTGLVSCGGPNQSPCTTCDLFLLTKNIADFIAFRFTPVVGTLIIVFAGLQFILSGGNQGKVTSATSLLKNTIIAVFIIYGAWLITNFTMRSLAGNSNIATKWYQLECPGGSSGGGQNGGGLPVDEDGDSSDGGGGSGGGSSDGGGGSGDGSGTEEETILTENGARKILADSGISINNPPGSCSPGCTNLEGVRRETIAGAIDLKNKCECEIVVTGGTESGHESGTISHENGYKLDFRRNPQLNSYIKDNFPFIGIRSSDGAKLYRDPDTGAVYAEESNHWDVKGWDATYGG